MVDGWVYIGRCVYEGAYENRSTGENLKEYLIFNGKIFWRILDKNQLSCLKIKADG